MLLREGYAGSFRNSPFVIDGIDPSDDVEKFNGVLDYWYLFHNVDGTVTGMATGKLGVGVSPFDVMAVMTKGESMLRNAEGQPLGFLPIYLCMENEEVKFDLMIHKDRCKFDSEVKENHIIFEFDDLNLISFRGTK